MSAQHWFDTLHRAVIVATSRRDVMRIVAALLPGFLLGAASAEAANKKKGKNGKKRGGKGKKPKRPDHLGPPDPNVDDCDAFLDDPGEQENCKRDRERCRAPNQFCIHAIDNDGDDDIRGYSCCSDGKECCITGCKDTRSDPEYCGAGCGAPCDEGEHCVNGECQEACPSGFARCTGSTDCTPITLPCCGRWRCGIQNATCCPGPGGELDCWWPNTPCDG